MTKLTCLILGCIKKRAGQNLASCSRCWKQLKDQKINLNLNEILEIIPNQFEDQRGFLFESYKSQELEKLGINDVFVQENHIGSRKNVIRGLHLQKEPYQTSKLVRCIVGEVFDVSVDLRKDSPTFGKWKGVTLSAKNRKIIYIPKGFAHGVCGLSEWSEIVYKMSQPFNSEYEVGILWNDPDVGISWPTENPILSEKDAKQPSLKELRKSF